MNNTDIASANQARDYVISQGGRIAILAPPHVMLGWVTSELAQELIGNYGIEFISHDPVDLSEFKYQDEQSLAAVRFFNSVASGSLQEGIQPNAPPLVNDLPGRRDVKSNSTSARVAVTQGNCDTMRGTVAVKLFFVESDGSGSDPNVYNWSSTDQQNTYNLANSGLSWWSSKAPSESPVSFTVTYYSATDSIAQQPYEPIRHRGLADAHLWVDQIMAKLGFTNAFPNNVADYNTSLKGSAGTNWAYSVFIAYNPSGDTSFQEEVINGQTVRLSAYTFDLGGPYVQMLFRNNGYAASADGYVLRHETGHILGV